MAAKGIFAERQIYASHYVFAFPTDTDKAIKKSSAVCTPHTSSSLLLPYRFARESDYFKTEGFRALVQGVFFGLVIAIMVYTLFLWATTRRRAYAHQMLFIATLAAVQASLKGTGFQFLQPAFPQLNDYAIATAGAFNLIFLNTFARYFLRITVNPWMLKVSNIFIALGIIYAGASLVLDYFIIIIPIALTIMLRALCVVSMGVIRFRQGQREARFYLLAWFAMELGRVIYRFKPLGLLPVTDLTEYSMQIGSALEMMLLSPALADRLNTMGDKLKGTSRPSSCKWRRAPPSCKWDCASWDRQIKPWRRCPSPIVSPA